jgi:cell division protein FtsW (lipid II flippase)
LTTRNLTLWEDEMDKEKLRKLRVHLLCGGLVTLVLLVSVISRMASGERLLQASWNSVKEIRPFEWVMIVLFWWVAASQKARDEKSSGSMTTLGLSEKR